MDVVVWREGELVEQLGLRDEDEVVILGEVLKQQTQTPQVADVDEVSTSSTSGIRATGLKK